MKETKFGTYIYGEENHTFTFDTDLSVSKKAQFVNSVASLVVDDEYYNSVIRDLVFDFYIIDVFTYIDTDELTNSDHFLDSVEDFLLETNIVEIVKANVSPALLDELNRAVDKAIEYKTGIHPSPLGEALASLINTLEKKVNVFDMNDAMEMVQKFVGIADDLNVDNVVNAYINSNTHKNNLDEIAKSKNDIQAVIEENRAEKVEVDE